MQLLDATLEAALVIASPILDLLRFLPTTEGIVVAAAAVALALRARLLRISTSVLKAVGSRTAFLFAPVGKLMDRWRTDRRTISIQAFVVFAFVASAAIAVSGGLPPKLPSIALGSPVLLLVERGAAALLAFVVVGVIVDRGLAGELPTELRGVKYADRDATAKLADKTAESIDELGLALTALEIRLATIEDELNI